jgi:sialidase-1
MIRILMRSYFFLTLLIVFENCTPKTIAIQNHQPLITATSPAVPLLKGMNTNPLLRLRIYVPPNGDIQFDKILCSLNETGIKSIENLDVFFTGTEPNFSELNKIASIQPTAQTFNIDFTNRLNPGLHYIWFSARLKDDAEIDGRIEFHANTISKNSGQQLKISEEGGDFSKRMGIALRMAEQENVHTYRIPGIIKTNKGSLIAVYDNRYERTGDLPGNIDVGMSRSTDGGKTWSRMKVIMDMGPPHENNGVGDPSILFDPVTNKIWVSALWSKGNRSIAGSGPGLTPDETGQFAMVSSSDDGLTWTQPYSITSQVKKHEWNIFFPGPGNGIAMQDGKIVFPAQYWDAQRMPHSTLVYSDDHGATWKTGTGAKSNTTEAQVVETTPGTLMLNMRDNRGSYRSVATTTNLGTSWIEHHTSYKALPDPVCQASIIKAKVNVKGQQKDVLFFSNVASSTARLNMTIKASLDYGETWLPINQLLIDERRTYGYSALTQIDENTIGLLYEGIRNLYFVRIPVKDIIQ